MFNLNNLSLYYVLGACLISTTLHLNAFADTGLVAFDPSHSQQVATTNLELEPRPIKDIHKELLNLYTPFRYRKGEQKLVNHMGSEPFSGDCIDFYIAAHNQLQNWGYVPYARFLHRKKDGEGHLVACIDAGKKTLCLDPNSKFPRTLGRLHREYRTVRIKWGLTSS